MQKPTATGAAPNIRTGDRLTDTTTAVGRFLTRARRRVAAAVTDEPQTTVADCCAHCRTVLLAVEDGRMAASYAEGWELAPGMADSGGADDTCGRCGEWMLDESDRPDGFVGVAAGAAVAVIRQIGGVL